MEKNEVWENIKKYAKVLYKKESIKKWITVIWQKRSVSNTLMMKS